MYEYELFLQGEEGEKVSWESARQISSLEHIYPQTPDDDWQAGFQNFSYSERKRLCNSLGNLLLISQKKNSSLRNKGFAYKKNHSSGGEVKGYFNGSHSEIAVAQNEKWTPREIVMRGLELLEFMEQRWDIRFNGDLEKRKILFLDDLFD